MLIQKAEIKDDRVALLERCGLEVADTEEGIDEQVSALAALCLRKSKWFIKAIWPAVEGVPLTWNWHIDLILDALDRCTTGETKELVICIPPGEMKSLLVSVFWPAHIWLTNPHKRLLCFANADDLTIRDGERMRQVMNHPWYKELRRLAHEAYGVPDWRMSKSQNEKQLFANTATGFRQNLSIRAAVTGKRGDIHIIDDPIDAKAALIGSNDMIHRRMEDVWGIYKKVLSTRVNDHRNYSRVTIMQRLHVNDLAGHLLRDGVECIVLPSEFDPDLTIRMPDGTHRSLIHEKDPRTRRGELLNKVRRPPEVIAVIKHDMGGEAYEAQHGQRPTPADGTIFRKGWFSNRYDMTPTLKARLCDRIVASIDCNFKKTSRGSYAVIQIWGITGQHGSRMNSLLWQVRKRMGWLELEATSKRQITMWNVDEAWIEDKANGSALIEALRAGARRLDGMPIIISPFDPGTRDKVERAQLGSAPAMQGGVCEFPRDADAPWMPDYVANHLAFPDGAYDDEIDATSQFLIRAHGAGAYDPMQAVDEVCGWMFN